VIECFN